MYVLLVGYHKGLSDHSVRQLWWGFWWYSVKRWWFSDGLMVVLVELIGYCMCKGIKWMITSSGPLRQEPSPTGPLWCMIGGRRAPELGQNPTMYWYLPDSRSVSHPSCSYIVSSVGRPRQEWPRDNSQRRSRGCQGIKGNLHSRVSSNSAIPGIRLLRHGDVLPTAL